MKHLNSLFKKIISCPSITKILLSLNKKNYNSIYAFCSVTGYSYATMFQCFRHLQYRYKLVKKQKEGYTLTKKGKKIAEALLELERSCK